MNEVSSFDTEEALIETIRGIFIGNDKTRVGGAYHSIIEGKYRFDAAKGLYHADDIIFTAEQALPAREFKRAHAGMIHEVLIRKIYHVRDKRILVSGRVDGLEGASIRDTKCKFRDPDFGEYLDSYQWRFYLDMLELDSFFYDLFEVRGFEALQGNAPYFLPDVEFLPAEALYCHRLDYLHESCLQLLQEFMDYIEAKNFYHYLKIENETALL